LSSPGLEGNLTYGSSGRKALQAQVGGGKATGFNWFLAANAFHESGWRFDSPSDVRQGFAAAGLAGGEDRCGVDDHVCLQHDDREWRAGLPSAGAELFECVYGAGYDRQPGAIGDVNVRHTPGGALTLAGNGYYRNIRTDVINGNLNADSLDQSVYQPNAAEQQL